MKKSVGRFTLGVVLLALGVALALDIYGGIAAMRQLLVKWWPLAIVLLGVEYIVVSHNPEVNARLSGGAVFLIILVLISAMFYEAGSNWGQYIHFGDFGNFSITATQGYTYQVEVDEAFGTGVTELELKAIGDVIVTGAPVDSVTGTASITVRARTVEEAERYAREIRLVPRHSGRTLYLEVVRPDSVPRSGVSYAPSFILTVPEGADLSIRTVSGEIEVSGVTGEVDLNNVSGGVEVDGKPSRVEVEMVSGGFEGSLGPLMKELSVESVSGSIDIEVPEGTGGSVSARTVSGSISSPRGQVSVNRSPGRNQASGTVGTGSTVIEVVSVSGSITID